MGWRMGGWEGVWVSGGKARLSSNNARRSPRSKVLGGGQGYIVGDKDGTDRRGEVKRRAGGVSSWAGGGWQLGGRGGVAAGQAGRRRVGTEEWGCLGDAGGDGRVAMFVG